MLDTVAATTESADAIRREWAAQKITERLAVLRRARHIFAECIPDLCDAIPAGLARSASDTRAAEVLPLLEACRFLERETERILAPRRLGRRRLPFWLSGVVSEVHRAPIGRVLVIAPANYPLFLPGVQVLQALAAGNSAVWKPGHGGRAVALIFAAVLREAGVPDGLLEVTDETVEAVHEALARGVDKVFFTGSASNGRALLTRLAQTATPCVMELSGCDAVFVLPSADLSRVVKALAFGMRLNGSATCMAPRRVILVGANAEGNRKFIDTLLKALGRVEGVRLAENAHRELQILLEDARSLGAQVHGQLEGQQQPVVLTGVTPAMKVAHADIFAPVLGVMEAADAMEAIALHEACPYALTAAVFGGESEARSIAERVTAGTVTINDLIVPTVDPRVPFGGRKDSGFGSTRGEEGLLEMTSAKTIAIQRNRSTRQYDATTVQHEALFDGVIAASHARRWQERLKGAWQMVRAAGKIGRGDT